MEAATTEEIDEFEISASDNPISAPPDEEGQMLTSSLVRLMNDIANSQPNPCSSHDGSEATGISRSSKTRRRKRRRPRRKPRRFLP